MRSATPAWFDRGDRVAAADHGERRAARPRRAPRRRSRRRRGASRTRPWVRSTRSSCAARSVGPEALDAGRAEVQPHLIGRDLADADTARPDGLSSPAATTASTGSTICTPRRRAVSSADRAISMRSGSTSDLPTSCPSARRKVNAMPPPIEQRVDLRQQVLDQRDLVRDLGAAEQGDQRTLPGPRGSGPAPPARGASAGPPRPACR